jgi:RHS repeat-associated protein
MADNAVYTQGSNFGNLLQKGVDPRTGQYTCAIDVWEAASQARNCPPLKLTLSFNPLNPANMGLGEGWFFNFTYYDHNRRTLKLSTSESFQVRESQSSVTIPDQKLLNFQFKKLGSDFHVVYKSGLIEVLRNDNGIFNKYVPYEIYAANGRHISLVWESFGGHPQLSKIQESSDDLLEMDYSAFSPKIIRYPNTTEESVLRFQLKDNRLANLVLPLSDKPSWAFEYGGYKECGQSVCITQLISPTGLIEMMAYNLCGHKLPPGAPMASIPYVGQHTVKPGNNQPDIVTTYKFSDTNYLGYGGSNHWRDGEDNLYQISCDYEYWSRVTVEGGMEVTSTFNHFHLLVLSEKRKQNKGAKKIKERYTYYAKIPDLFACQVPQLQMPKVIERTYEEDGCSRPARVETTQQEYDEWGNPTKVIQPDGVEIRRTYYPPEGEESEISGSAGVGCPPDPHGFSRYMKTETVIPAPSEYPAPQRTERYQYCRIATADGAPADYFVTAQQQLSLDGDQILARTAFAYVEEPTARDHGRLTSQVTSHLGSHATAKTWEFEWLDDSREITITARTTTFDELSVSEQTRYSTISGLTQNHKDPDGVEDCFDYDTLGRINKVTTSPGTKFEAIQTYSYQALEKDKGVRTEVTDVNSVKTCYISDGLGRRCRVEKQDPVATSVFRVVSARNYNAQGQCIEVTETDWLTSEDGKPSSSREISQTIEYDDWGQIYRATERAAGQLTGRVTLSISDPIDRCTTAGIEGEGTIKSWYNDGNRPVRTAFYKANGSFYSEAKYRYDGLNRLVEKEDQLGHVIKYASDSFDRITETNWSAGRNATTTYDDTSPATLPVKVCFNNRTVGEQQFDGLGRVKRQDIGPRITTQTYKGSSSEPADIKDAQGNVCTMEYEPALQYMPKSITWNGGSDSFVYDTKTGLPIELKGVHRTQTRQYCPSASLRVEEIALHEGESFSTDYRFSMAGRLQHYTNPHKQTQSVDYDPFGRPFSMIQDKIKVTLQYDQASRLKEHQVEDQETGTVLSAVMTYDDFGRESSREIGKNQKALFVQYQEYNEAGLLNVRILLDENKLPLRDEEFGYDDQNRLIEYKCSGKRVPLDEQGRSLQSQTFEFDDYDNITKKTTVFQDESSNTTTYTYDTQDPCRLLQIKNTHDSYPPEITLCYDPAGHLTRDEQGRQLEYDPFGRLIRVRNANKQLLCEYRYDASGKLASQLVPGKPETYLFYRDESLIATKAGEHRTSYLSDGKTYWGQITQENQNQPPQAQLWAANGHDTVLAWVDSHAPDNDIQYQSYTPYGLGADSTSIGFSGQWRDPITGWYHLGNGYRVYNPALQRFHSPDPWSPFSSGEANPYTYCMADPINRTDPSGHFSIFGIEINWKTFFSAALGIAGSVIVGVLTAGASLAVEIAIGAVVGGVASAVGGVIGDLADGKTPTWSSVGMDFGIGLAGGLLGPVVGRAWGAASKAIGSRLTRGILGELSDVLPSFGSVASKTVSSAVWRTGWKESLETVGAEALFEQATANSVKSFFMKSLPLKAAWNTGVNMVMSDDSQPSSQQSQSQSGSGVRTEVWRAEKLGSPYVASGSNIARDSIRPMVKNIQPSALSIPSSAGQSIADMLNLNSRCSFALSKEERGERSGAASFDSLRARIRNPPNWAS